MKRKMTSEVKLVFLFLLLYSWGIYYMTVSILLSKVTSDLTPELLDKSPKAPKTNSDDHQMDIDHQTGIAHQWDIAHKTVITSSKQQPMINFSFIKIHRVGSGTFHNVLVRFAIKHNTLVALADVPLYEVFPRQISRDLLLPPPIHPKFTHYNMLIDHVIFNKTASDAILPKGVRYITQVRHPYTHAASVYLKYCNDSYKWYDPGNETFPDVIRSGNNFEYSVTRNMMALELGYYRRQVENNVPDFLDYLKVLDKQLFHVNMLEELPESLVLLKRKMNWELKDLLHSRIHKRALKDRPIASEYQLQLHRQWNSLDYALYDHFLARHKREVAQQDGTFIDEVQAFITIQEDFTNFCSHLVPHFQKLDHSNIALLRMAMKTSHVVASSKFQDAFTVTYEDCTMLTINELKVKRVLKYHMYSEACEKDPRLAKKLDLCCNTKEHILPGLTTKRLNEILDNKK